MQGTGTELKTERSLAFAEAFPFTPLVDMAIICGIILK